MQIRQTVEGSLGVHGHKVTELVDGLFWKDLEYRTYWLIKKSARYDGDVANKIHRMTKKSTV